MSTVWVASSASGNADGSQAAPFQTVQQALQQVSPGDTVVVEGRFRSTTVTGVKMSAPVTIRCDAEFSSGNLAVGHGLKLERCRNLHWVGDIRCHTVLSGVRIHGCADLVMDGLDVGNSGHEAIHIALNSRHVTLRRPYVHGTGKLGGKDRQYQRPHFVYGEGIYIGSGVAGAAPDATSDVLIDQPHITDTGNEAIECKPGTSRVTIRRGWVHGCNVELKGAVKLDGGGHLVEDMDIWDITGTGLYGSDASGVYVKGGTHRLRRVRGWNIKDRGVLQDSGHLIAEDVYMWDTGRSHYDRRGGSISGTITRGAPAGHRTPTGQHPWSGTTPTAPPPPPPPSDDVPALELAVLNSRLDYLQDKFTGSVSAIEGLEDQVEKLEARVRELERWRKS